MVAIFCMNPGSSISFALIPINRKKKTTRIKTHTSRSLAPSCGHFALKLFALQGFALLYKVDLPYDKEHSTDDSRAIYTRKNKTRRT